MRACVLAALAVLLTGCGGSDPPRRVQFGFNDQSSLTGQLTADAAAAAQARAGANSTRIPINWGFTETAPGAVSLEKEDAAYRAALAHGLAPLIVVFGSPRWAHPSVPGCAATAMCPPGRRHDADFRGFVAGVTKRYPAAVAIKIWNEPNLPGFWNSGPDPARYAEVLAEAYAGVRSVRADLPVLGGSLAPIDDVGGFLSGMYKAGAKAHMDAIAVHPYPLGSSLRRTATMLADVKRVRDGQHDDAPLWITEIGLSTTGPNAVSEATQATLLPRVVKSLLTDHDVRGIYVHTLIEPRGAGGAELGYGLLRGNGAAKPAYCAIARLRRAKYECPRTLATP